MSVDSKDKHDSKFPRSSLRARNKTVVMEPAALDDFRGDSAWQDVDGLNIDDLLEDNILETDEVSVDDIQQDLQSTAIEENQHLESSVFEDTDDGDLESQETSVFEEQEEIEEQAGEYQERALTSSDDPEEDQTGALDGSAYEDSLIDEGFESSYERDSEEQDLDESDEEFSDVLVPSENEILWRRPTRLVGFLVALDATQERGYVELHEGRLLVSREENNSENCLVLRHQSVSTMHAIMMVSADGSILILDQLSESGTIIRRAKDGREESLMGDKQTLHHGDVVVFGECAYNVCIIDFSGSKVDA